jgi:nucleotide-binding universal stress UspA family protein
MYSDLVIFSDTDTVAETVAAVRLLCLPRGRTRIFIPNEARDAERERSFLTELAGAGIHLSLDALDPREAQRTIVSHIVQNCQAIAVVRPDGSSLSLGILERTLLNHSPVPLWFWNSRLMSDWKIVMAGDPDPTNHRRNSLNVKAVEVASSFARRCGGSMLIANAWQLDGEHDMRTSPFLRIHEAEIAESRIMLKTSRRADLDALANRCELSGVSAEIDLREGVVDAVIPAVVKEHEASVLVIGTMQRRGLAALVRPNTVSTIGAGFDGILAVVPPSNAGADSGGGGLSRIAAGVAFT